MEIVWQLFCASGTMSTFKVFCEELNTTCADKLGLNWTLCADELGFKINEQQFERVHWLGKYTDKEQRPIIAKLTLFKDKERILSCGHKLKGTSTYICEYFSPETRHAGRKLMKFTKAQNKAYRRYVDKLCINSTTYIYNSAEKAIVPLNR